MKFAMFNEGYRDSVQGLFRSAMALALACLLIGSASRSLAQQTPNAPRAGASLNADAPGQAPKLVEGESRTQLPDGRILVLGGARATTAARVFDPRTDQTAYLPEGLVVARRLQAAVLLPSGQVLVLGGRDSAGNVVTEATRFDPSTGHFESAGDLGLLPRAGQSAKVLTDGTVLVVGGRGSRGEAITSAELFDPRTGRVQEVDRLAALDRSGGDMQLLTDGRVLISGGRDASGNTQKSALVYQTELQRFAPVQANELSVLLPTGAPGSAPKLAGSLPQRDDRAFDPNGIVGLRFSQALVPASVRSETVTLIGPAGAVRAVVSPSEDGLIAFITPERPLRPGANYTVVIKGVRSASGGTLALSTLAFATRDLGSIPKGATFSRSGAGLAGNAGAAGAAGAGGGGAAGSDETVVVTVPGQAINDDEIFVPTDKNLMGRWRTDRPLPRVVERQINDAITLKVSLVWENAHRGRKSALLQRVKPFADRFPRLTTGVSGVVLKLNDQPLANVAISIGKRRTRTDASGHFAMLGLNPGHYELFVDGSTAGGPGFEFGKFIIGADVEQNDMTELATVYLPKIRAADWIDVPNPVRQEIVVKHPNVPGMEVRIPKGTVLRERDGRLVTKIALIPIPLDRTPIPFPTNAPVFVSVQPDSLTVEGLTAGVTPGVRILYPNATLAKVGSRADFWKYDPSGKGWYVYGKGGVTADERQVAPDAGVESFDTIGFMFTPSGSAPDPTRKPGGGCPSGGAPDPKTKPNEGKPKTTDSDPCQKKSSSSLRKDPVDTASGLFIQSDTDLSVSDVMPVFVTRTYRPDDAVVRAFGLGTSHPFATYLHFPGNDTTSQTFSMVMSDGSVKTFTNISATSTKVFEYTGNDPQLYKATIKFLKGKEDDVWRWVLRRRDGSQMEFDAENGYVMTRIVDRSGNSIQFVYNSGRLTRILTPSGRYIDFSYDTSNRIWRAEDISGRVVTYTYSTATDPGSGYPPGYLWKVTDPDNKVEEYTYDSNGRMTRIKDKRSNVVVTNTYDTSGRVIQQDHPGSAVVTYAYTTDAGGKITRTDMTDARLLVTRMQFNAAGLMTSRIEAFGTALARTTAFEYRSTDNLLLATVDPLGRRTEYDYDTFGNVLTTRSLAGTANQLTETYTYTPDFNQLATYTDARSQISRYFYDPQGRLTEVRDPLLNSTKFEYNSQGLVTRVTDPRNKATVFAYLLTDLASVTDPLNRATQVFTDVLGRVTQVIDPLGNRTQSAYDKLSRPTSTTDPLGKVVSMVYDANGNLTSFTDPRSGVTGFGYDARNRLTSRTDPLLKTETLVPDGNDNVTSRTDRKSQITTTTYDALDRPAVTTWQGGATSTYTWDAGDRLTRIVDSVSGTITRQYDIRFDTLTQEVAPLGAYTGTVNYQYDTAGRRSQMQTLGQTAFTYGYDNANRLTSITQGGNVVSFGYDAASRRTTATLPFQVTIDYGYSDANELTSLTHKRAGTTLQNLTYGYDLAGRRITMGGTAARINLPPALSSATYDAGNRLTTWAGVTQSYDFNGNLTNDGVNTYTWDVRDRLSALSGSIPISNVYDAFNRRTSKTQSGVQGWTMYDGFKELHGITPAGVLVSTFLNGPGLDERYVRANTSNGITDLYLTDGLGSTLSLVSSAGVINGAFTYEPYGTSSLSGSNSTGLRYTGRAEDTPNLMYYRNRYYNPRTSRFISEDPIGLAGGYNLYAYVGGDPVEKNDPLGLLSPQFMMQFLPTRVIHELELLRMYVPPQVAAASLLEALEAYKYTVAVNLTGAAVVSAAQVAAAGYLGYEVGSMINRKIEETYGRNAGIALYELVHDRRYCHSWSRR